MNIRLARVRAATTGIAWCAIGRLAGAQVAGIGIDPHMVVLTDARRSGEITVLNPHAQRAGFSVDLRFGFATTDADGKLRVELRDGPDSASAADWILPYPNHFTLRGGATRTVRLLARPPANIPDGEYWARLTVHSVADAPRDQSDSSDDTGGRVRISMETATVIPLFFRKGAVSTGVSIGAVNAIAHGDTLDVRATLTRTGNGAFIGVAHITLQDAAGTVVAAADRQLAVYRTMEPRWTLPIPATASLDGCTVAISLSTDRRDVPRAALLHAAPVRTVVVPVRSNRR